MSDTGIVQSLWYLVELIGKTTISFVVCEFLQICILFKQYIYADQQIIHTWPIPTINKTDGIGTNLLLHSNYNHNHNNNISSTLPTVDTILRYYYLRGIVYMGCQRNDHAIRCFWTCLSLPSPDDCNTISAIAIEAWKKLILLQSLSPIGIIHTTINELNDLTSNNYNINSDFHETASVMMPSTSNHPSMNTTIPPTIGATKAINPFATPIGMSSELQRFIKEAKSPSPHIVDTNNTSDHTYNTSTMMQQQDDNDMHIVPIESTTTNRIDSTTSFAAMPTRFYPNLGVYVYKELVNAFICIDRNKFDTIFQECQDLFYNDGNYGSICRLYNALFYRQIYVISRTYATITLNDLSNEMNLSIVPLRLLLETMQSNLAWPIQLISSSRTGKNNNENETAIIFPSELPHPTLESYYVTPIQEQLIELSNTVQQLNTMMESSKKYTDAITYEKQNKNHFIV
jgi:hypothetical protein